MVEPPLDGACRHRQRLLARSRLEGFEVQALCRTGAYEGFDLFDHPGLERGLEPPFSAAAAAAPVLA